MPKPWAKYEVGFIDHRKFQALPAAAICLWIEGKNYADKQLSDGILPFVAVKHFRWYTKNTVALLMHSCGVKNASGDLYAPLWEPIDQVGWRMHDYLDHNPCREEVLQRLDDAEERNELRKLKNRERQTAFRERRAELLDAAKCNAVVALQKALVTPVTSTPSVSVSVPVSETDLSEASERDIEKRAAALLETYDRLYATHRHGAKHRRSGSNLQWLEACELCRHWDDERLSKLATLVLTTDDPYISTTDRSFKIFSMKATWADDRLSKWEAEQREKAR